MTALCADLYVRVQQLDGPRAPQPLPLANGFSSHTAYRVLGLYSPSETSEAYFILSNDRDEVWFISNRHLRTHAILPGTTTFRLSLVSGDGTTQGVADVQPAVSL